MAQMLPMIQILPNMNLGHDAVSGVIGASEGVILLSMDEINNEVTKLQGAADELVSSLDPYTSPAGAYPGREGSYVTAGMLTNVVYGFVLAIIIIFAALPILIKLGVL